MGVVLPRALFAAPITLFWTVAAMARQVTEAAPVVVPPIPSGGLNSGDTAWMLTSTALVLLMTIPGLALFYGRHGPQNERTSDGDAELRGDLPRHGLVDGGRL